MDYHKIIEELDDQLHNFVLNSNNNTHNNSSFKTGGIQKTTTLMQFQSLHQPTNKSSSRTNIFSFNKKLRQSTTKLIGQSFKFNKNTTMSRSNPVDDDVATPK